MINIHSLSHQYAEGSPISFPNWTIKPNEQWLLLGASGSGKSTLLNILAGLLKPTSGSVYLGDTDLYQLSSSKLDNFRGKRIGIVFQRPHLIKSLTIAENLAIASSMIGNKVDKVHNMFLLETLSIADKASKYPDELSQGQLQRVSVARALVNKPDLLISDEPTSSLDDQNTSQVIEMLQEQARMNGATLIVATHDQRIKSNFSNAYQL